MFYYCKICGAGREADHSPPSSAEVKEWVELYLYSPKTPSWRGAQLGGAQGQDLWRRLGKNPRPDHVYPVTTSLINKDTN